MSVIGHSINGGLVLLVVVAVVGTVGATFYYQHSVEQLDDRTDVLSNRTQTLERSLTATRADLRTAQTHARELNRSLAVAESDVSTLSKELKRSRKRGTAASSELTEKRRRLASASSSLADAKADLRVACDRLEELDARDETAVSEPTGTPADPWADEPWNDEFVYYGGEPDPTPTPTGADDGGAASPDAAVCEE